MRVPSLANRHYPPVMRKGDDWGLPKPSSTPNQRVKIVTTVAVWLIATVGVAYGLRQSADLVPVPDLIGLGTGTLIAALKHRFW